MKFEDMLNTVTLGNSYEIIKDIPGNSIDLIVTDPPYEYTTGGGAGCFGTKKRKYHSEYYKIATNTNRLNERKIKNRDEIKHISSGINYSILEELDRIMK